MSANDIYINFHDEFNAAIGALETARTEFLAASNSYSNDGEQSKNTVISQLERLDDPARAAQVREGAFAATAAVRSFAAINATLTAQVDLLLQAFNMRIIASTVKMIPATIFEIPANSSLPIQEAIDNYVKNLDVQLRKNVVLAASAIILGNQVADAVRAATEPIVMRQATLAQASRELVPDLLGATGGIGKVIDVGESVSEEINMEILKEIVKHVALELGTHIPIAGIVVSIARVASDVHARQTALRKRSELQLGIRDAQYQRGPVDVMFDLPIQLQDEDQITAGVLALISQLFAVMQQAIPEL
jgi:hypothetical protein